MPPIRTDEMGLSLKAVSLEWAFSPGAPMFLSVPRLIIQAGEAVAVTGPSGSGKTSLLFLLGGMERPSAGRIIWDGRDITALSEGSRDTWRRENVGLVFQDFRLVEDLSVLQNVLLPASFSRWRPGRELESRALMLMARMNLSKPRQITATLSRGEMQRTALARALLFRPRLILADEPTASLDAGNEQAVGDLLFDAAREEGATLLVATHQKSLRDRADRVIAMDHGRVSPKEAHA
jgi:putative ABC transport system ATP-binding protein